MRIVGVILVAAVVGATIGAAIAYVEVRPAPQVASSAPRLVGSATSAGAAPAQTSTGPQAEVPETTFQFGTMQRGTSKTHEFVVRNVGHGPLTLSVGSTTCKCTVGNVANEPIEPGSSVNVKLEWSALINPGPFRQTATILTNDPAKLRFDLSVEGEVTDATGVYPPDFMLDKVTAGEAKSADVYVMALAEENLQVTNPELSNAETRQFFDVTIEPMKPADLPNPKAKAGVRVRVTAKPGLRMGRFDQWLAVSTNIPDAEKIKIPVAGRVVGNISVHGRMWNEDQGVLRLGRVKSAEGMKAPLAVVVRGEGAENVQLSVASIDPPELKATLGVPQKVKEALVRVPLEIEVPPGTPPMARLDIAQHDEAKVVLKTNLPEAPEIVLGVRFAVER